MIKQTLKRRKTSAGLHGLNPQSSRPGYDSRRAYNRCPEHLEGGRRHLAVAWAACKVDGHLHINQWRALAAVQTYFAVTPGPEASLTPKAARDLIDALERDRDSLNAHERRRLFVTGAWVTVADGRSHGLELWLLCELRRALGISPKVARGLFRDVKLARLRSLRDPGLLEFEALMQRWSNPAPAVPTDGHVRSLGQPEHA